MHSLDARDSFIIVGNTALSGEKKKLKNRIDTKKISDVIQVNYPKPSVIWLLMSAIDVPAV